MSDERIRYYDRTRGQLLDIIDARDAENTRLQSALAAAEAQYQGKVAEIGVLLDRCRVAEAARAVLVEALKPFAEHAKVYDHFPTEEAYPPQYIGVGVSIGQVRKARDILASLPARGSALVEEREKMMARAIYEFRERRNFPPDGRFSWNDAPQSVRDYNLDLAKAALRSLNKTETE